MPLFFFKALFSLLCVKATFYITGLISLLLQKEENTRRAQRGESLLSMTDEAVEQDLNLKPVVPPSRLEALLVSEQVDMRCKQVTEIAGEAFAKLYLAEGLQPK